MNLEIAADEPLRQLRSKAKSKGFDIGEDVIAEVVFITPAEATRWLKSNRINRPVQQSWVEHLADQMRRGQWCFNGEAIIVSDGENILNGQHRLLACIKAGYTFQTLVIYGISDAAFATIDTGKPRSAGDALALYRPNEKFHRDIASAVRWLEKLERHFTGPRGWLSNRDVLDYVDLHPSLQHCVAHVASLPMESRPMVLGAGIALYEFLQRKHQETARDFITNLYTGENLTSTQPEYVLRNLFAKDAARLSGYSPEIKMKMCIKAWNVKRRNIDATSSLIQIGPRDEHVFKAM